MDQTTCSDDWVELNSDNFVSKHCGQISEPWSIITNTNTLTVTFKSNSYGTLTGFLAVWTATSEPPTYSPAPTSCDNCDFPFMYLGETFDTCISVQDVDTQPWCSGPLSAPTDEGTHVLPPPPKISCSNSDSLCPSLPSKTLVTSPDYPLNYPNNADEVKLIDIYIHLIMNICICVEMDTFY